MNFYSFLNNFLIFLMFCFPSAQAAKHLTQEEFNTIQSYNGYFYSHRTPTTIYVDLPSYNSKFTSIATIIYGYGYKLQQRTKEGGYNSILSGYSFARWLEGV